MSSFIHLPTSKRRVAFAARVSDIIRAEPLAGAVAVISVAPAEFQSSLAIRRLQYGSAWDSLERRPDRTLTAADGCFCFVDLPDGTYTVTVSGRPGTRYAAAQRTFTVARDAQGRIAAEMAEIGLSPTGIRGKLEGPASPDDPTPEPIVLARIRARGSGEVARSDEQGRFVLLDLEPGMRDLDVRAEGRMPVSLRAQIAEGAVADAGTITLKAAPP